MKEDYEKVILGSTSGEKGQETGLGRGGSWAVKQLREGLCQPHKELGAPGPF